MERGKNNSGNCNSGNCNSGNWNSGNWNTGNRNTGYRNSGNCNTGNSNSGNCNSGNWNTGNRNTGNSNSGNCNSGNWNTGDWNTGNCNSGNCNSGNWNTGDRNTGNWNTGDCNSGNCNSGTPSEILVFNKPCSREAWENAEKPQWMYATLTRWVSEGDMTDAEKTAYPSYVTTGGFLKCYPSLKAAFVDAWENATEEDRALTEKLPNFDPHVFAEVFGFDPFKSRDDRTDCQGRTVEIDGKRYRLELID